MLEAQYTERKNHEFLIREKEEFRLKTQELTKALNRLTAECVSQGEYNEIVNELGQLEALK